MTLLLLSLLACSGDKQGDTAPATNTGTDPTDDTGTETTPPAVWVSLSLSANVTALTTRDVATLTATATDDAGATLDVTGEVSWSSSAPLLLDVFTSGVAQPIDPGTATVTATFDGSLTATVDLTVTLAAAQAGDLVFNEVLVDATVDGDPNGDGTVDATQDEYVEIASVRATVDLSGVTIIEDDFPFLPRHTFAPGTVLHAGEVIVVFGGGDVSTLSADNASFYVANAEDAGLEYGLSLENSAETVLLMAPDATTILASIAYGTDETPVVEDASLVLDPEVVGTEYTHHLYAPDSAGAYSPGTMVTGTAFPGPVGWYQTH